MDHERIDVDKMDEIMLPGFRFHPTDEELVGFYLKKKIQQRPLSVELIRQLDIYKYDPWDLPKLAATGEKEWYFYCPRDRKYRNSARPNRVTGAGFWKATGTDRPIYSSDAASNKCIGLKKSLVFYKGRAAKGTKTDWMMHEFRLPSLTDHSSAPSKRFIDKTIPANDSWAICRIFKKTNSTAQRALSQSWVSPPSETITPRTSTMTANRSSPMQFSNDFYQQSSSIADHFPSFDHVLPSQQQHYLSSNNQCFPSNFMFSNTETCESSVLGDFGKACESIGFGGPQDHYLSLITLPKEIPVPNIMRKADGDETMFKNRSLMNIVDDVQSGVACNTSTDAWKSCFMWDSLPCPSEISAPYSSDY